MQCVECDTELKNDVYGNKCEDCWAVGYIKISNSNGRLGRSNHGDNTRGSYSADDKQLPHLSWSSL